MKNLHANSQRVCPSGGFALVVTLVMVTLLAIIAIGLLTSTSLERATAKSYTDRYQAELAVKNGLQAAAKTLVASPTMASSVTGQDTFLVVRADGAPDANGNKPAYYYLAQPSTGTSPTITYYPLFSSSTDPSSPAIQTQTINLTAQDAPNPQDPRKPFAPLVPAPSPPANSTASDSTSAWNAAKTQRLPTLYSWAQPTPSPSGPSVKWVQMRDAANNPLPYRYAYWAEDLDGYLDASQVGGQARTTGTSPQEIAMFTVFAPTQPTDATDPPTTAANTLINNRPLLFTVPTLQQLAQTTPDVTGPNLAVRLGVDTAEQNLTPLGYGYTGEGQPKPNLSTTLANAQQGNGNASNTIGGAITGVLQGFNNRSVTHQTRSKPGGGAPLTPVYDYAKNIGANIIDYVYPQSAPTDFMPKSIPYPTARGIGAYPFVTSVYDLNNWVSTYQKNGEYAVVIEVKTYVQLWNPHNVPASGKLTLQYKNADQIQIFNSANPNGLPPQLLASPPAATIDLGGSNAMKPNEYRVVVLPTPTPAP